MRRRSVRQQEGVGQRLRTERRARGLTQAELAERAGIALETVSRIEQGHTRPTIRTLDKIAGALGIPVRDLFSGEDATPPPAPPQPRSPALRRLTEILPLLDDDAVQHLLGIARLLLKKQKARQHR